MLRVVTHNWFNIKNSIQDISDLYKSYNIIFLQETWLFDHELYLLSNICSDFEGFGTSAMAFPVVFSLVDPMMELPFLSGSRLEKHANCTPLVIVVYLELLLI